MTIRSARDTRRSEVYEAERLIHRLFDRAGDGHEVQLAGTRLTLPVEARFASVESVRSYVARVSTLPSVVADFPAARRPPAIRERRGHRSAEYRPPTRSAGSAAGTEAGEIALPTSAQGRWALRELVVLHELAHHLDDSSDAAHGSAFIRTLTDLVGAVLGPEAGFVYRVVFTESGLR